MRQTMSMRVGMWLGLVCGALCIAPQVAAASSQPNFGSNVIVFSPSMTQSQIQSTLNSIAIQQVPNQFGSQRYAIFFEPGTYGSKTVRSSSNWGTTPKSRDWGPSRAT